VFIDLIAGLKRRLEILLPLARFVEKKEVLTCLILSKQMYCYASKCSTIISAGYIHFNFFKGYSNWFFGTNYEFQSVVDVQTQAIVVTVSKEEEEIEPQCGIVHHHLRRGRWCRCSPREEHAMP
jgi:hypothetical protein